MRITKEIYCVTKYQFWYSTNNVSWIIYPENDPPQVNLVVLKINLLIVCPLCQQVLYPKLIVFEAAGDEHFMLQNYVFIDYLKILNLRGRPSDSWKGGMFFVKKKSKY